MKRALISPAILFAGFAIALIGPLSASGADDALLPNEAEVLLEEGMDFNLNVDLSDQVCDWGYHGHHHHHHHYHRGYRSHHHYNHHYNYRYRYNHHNHHYRYKGHGHGHYGHGHYGVGIGGWYFGGCF